MTESGMVILVKLLHHSNASLLILVTEFGMVMFVRVSQKLNAPSPILVTESGIIMLLRLLQPENANFHTVRYNYLRHSLFFYVFFQNAVVCNFKSHIFLLYNNTVISDL